MAVNFFKAAQDTFFLKPANIFKKCYKGDSIKLLIAAFICQQFDHHLKVAVLHWPG